MNDDDNLSKQLIHDVLGQVTNINLAYELKKTTDPFIQALTNLCMIYRFIIFHDPDYNAIKNYAKYKQIKLIVKIDITKIDINIIFLLCIFIIRGSKSTIITLNETSITINGLHYEHLLSKKNGLSHHILCMLENKKKQLVINKCHQNMIIHLA